MLRAGLLVIASLVVAMALAGTAQASQEIEFFQVETSDTEAGGHPDIRTSFTLPNAGEPEVAKDIEIKWPQGVFGNPQAVPRCTALDFGFNQCPSNSQVGWISIRGLYEGDQFHTFGVAPIYDMEPAGELETARFAFTVPTLNIPIAIPIKVRTGSDYGLTLKVSGITQEIPLREADLRVWGFPADAEHDALRFPSGSPGDPPGCPGLLVPAPGSESCPDLTTPTSSGILVKPLIDNPTVCTSSPLDVELRVTSYQDPVPSVADAEYPQTTNCNSEVFRPVFNVGLTTDEADAPSGLNMQLVAKQVLGLTNAPSQLRSAVVTLPQGFSINPDAADGQRSCPDADANFGNEQPSNCPDTSKIGTMEVITPALDAPLTGGLYIGEPKPGNQYRLFMLFDGFGIHAKIAPQIFPDPQTGQLQIKVTDLPQVPFEQFNLHLFASDRGLIATPTQCTLYQTESEFVPWNDQVAPQTSRPNVSITSGPNGTGCPGIVRPFHPRLEAGTTTPVAGAYSSFILRLDRDDGDQFLGDLTFRMPPGFTGSLRGISYCSDASIAAAAQRLGRDELADPSCPASSLIGSTNVAAGPGSHPFHAVGKMYLAGPFKGAPLSVAAVTPALAGPYDYGVVVVRVALHVDPLTAQVSAVSDTVPSIIGGIPIRMRSIQVNIDKPNFTINPTNCSPFTVDSQGIGDQGTVTDFSSYFQAVNCGILPFKPSMTVKQLGKHKETKRSKNPKLRFELRTRNGDANIKSVAVTLPKAFAIDQRHLGNICSKSQLEAESCAGRQAIGTVETRTPLLDQPLRGPAYAVSGFGKLPRLAFILDGQVRLVPQAESSSVKGGHLKTVVPVVPDAPIGYFKLDLYGGKQGYLVNTRDLCTSPADITVEYTAQSGKKLKQKVATKTACGHKKKSKRAQRRR
ncbi:MAG TPA: hypothetical protein VH476_11380 [Solirubrobacterales bacterium]